jgi:hypothetical protein
MDVDFSTHAIETVNSYPNMITDKDCNQIIFSCQIINNMQSFFFLLVRGMFLYVQFQQLLWGVEIHFAYLI